MFPPGEGQLVVFRELAAHGYIKLFTQREWRFTDEGIRRLLDADADAQPANLHQHGDIVMGSKHVVTVSRSTIGAFAVGDQAHATGSVQVAMGDTMTQSQHRAAIQDAQMALVKDQDRLGEIHALLFDALHQFLRLAREIHVEQQALKDLVAKMKATQDEVWAQYEAKGLQGVRLPETLNLIAEIVKHPAMTEVVKQLVGGG